MFEVDAIIEIQGMSFPVKYEYDKSKNILSVDRVLSSSMVYPCHYGFIPNTMAMDGDPLDVLVYAHFPIMPGASIKVRPIGFMMMEDEKGTDEKVIAVPCSSIDKSYEPYKSYDDIPSSELLKIEHFFKHYKDLDNGKWARVLGWHSAEEAVCIIKKYTEKPSS